MVAEVEQLEEITLKEFILENKKNNINLIALRGSYRSYRNIGSIIRSAVAFNIDGYNSKRKIISHLKVNYFIKALVVVQNI